jgi:hypothetical protein
MVGRKENEASYVVVCELRFSRRVGGWPAFNLLVAFESAGCPTPLRFPAKGGKRQPPITTLACQRPTSLSAFKTWQRLKLRLRRVVPEMPHLIVHCTQNPLSLLCSHICSREPEQDRSSVGGVEEHIPRNRRNILRTGSRICVVAGGNSTPCLHNLGSKRINLPLTGPLPHHLVSPIRRVGNVQQSHHHDSHKYDRACYFPSHGAFLSHASPAFNHPLFEFPLIDESVPWARAGGQPSFTTNSFRTGGTSSVPQLY